MAGVMPGHKKCDALVSWILGLENLVAQGRGDDNLVMIENDSIEADESVVELEVLFWKTLFDHFHESCWGMRKDCSREWWLSGSVAPVIVAMSSGRPSGVGFSTGWHQLLHGKHLVCEWRWIYNAVTFFLRLHSQGLQMSSRQQSPNALWRGLWSINLIKLEHQMVKWQALSNASTTTSALPSTGV